MPFRPTLRRHRGLWVLSAITASLVAVTTGSAAATPMQATGTVARTSGATAVPKAATQPNILNIVLDDMRDDTLPRMSQYMPKTVRWFSKGRFYVNTDVPTSSCCQSRATGMTGQYDHNNGVRHQADTPKLDVRTTVQYYLKKDGYRTCQVGKYLHHIPTSTRPPFFDKFTTWLAADYNSFIANVDGKVQQINQYSTTYAGNRLMTYLHEFATTPALPWYCYVAIHAPHVVQSTGLAVPEPKYAHSPVRDCAEPGEADVSDKPTYIHWMHVTTSEALAVCQSQLRTLKSVDDQINRVMTFLQSSGQLAHTMVILWSDNGELFGEHNRDSKFVPYMPSVNIPLFVRWPGHVPAGEERRLVSTVDLAPTILQAAGVARNPAVPMDGRSLLRADARPYEFNEYWLDPDNEKVPTYVQVHDLHFAYTEYYDEATLAVTFREYYNLDKDPGQLVNLLGDKNKNNDPPAAEIALRHKQVRAAMTCKGGGCP